MYVFSTVTRSSLWVSALWYPSTSDARKRPSKMVMRVCDFPAFYESSMLLFAEFITADRQRRTEVCHIYFQAAV